MGATSIDVALQQLFDAIAFEHVVKRIVEGAEIGIDLFLQGAGQKAEPLAGLDRGAGEDDARHLLVDQRGNRHGDGEIGFAGPGRADAEYQVVAFDGFDVAALIDGFRRQHLLAEVALLAALYQLEQRDIGVAGDDTQKAVEIAVVEDMAFANQAIVVF